MKPSNRIIVNTLAQYLRTILNIILSLYSSRLVLNILGVDDYGIYALVAGVVSMLSFITNSLVGSTQRFLSVNQGKGNISELKKVFSNSVLLHIFLGGIVFIILEILTPILFNGFLNIPSGRVTAATIVYQQVVLMVYISFVASPYRALLVSRENIVYTSCIDVIDGVLKVVLVLMLPYINSDKLILYGWITLSINLFNFFAFSLYSHRMYEECVFPKLKYFTFSFLKNLFSYTGWVVYSTLCIALRTQGIAVVLNKFIGTQINAAYGLGSQISGMVSFISTSFANSISPQLMMAEGANDRSRMWFLAQLQSKYSFLLLSMISIPIIFEMDTLLHLWLGQEVPSYTKLFATMFILMQVVDMLTQGLATANRAIGNIAWYSILTYTPKLLILPIGYLLLVNKYSLVLFAVMCVIVEFLCMLLRIPLILKEKQFNPVIYIREVFVKSLFPVLASLVVCFFITNYITFWGRVIMTFSISIIVFIITAYFFLGKLEREKVCLMFNSFLNKIRKTK